MTEDRGPVHSVTFIRGTPVSMHREVLRETKPDQPVDPQTEHPPARPPHVPHGETPTATPAEPAVHWPQVPQLPQGAACSSHASVQPTMSPQR